jgi:hypothetical protein
MNICQVKPENTPIFPPFVIGSVNRLIFIREKSESWRTDDNPDNLYDYVYHFGLVLHLSCSSV